MDRQLNADWQRTRCQLAFRALELVYKEELRASSRNQHPRFAILRAAREELQVIYREQQIRLSEAIAALRDSR